jgi:hypothetical protein
MQRHYYVGVSVLRTQYPIATALYGGDCNAVVHTRIEQMRDAVTPDRYSN